MDVDDKNLMSALWGLVNLNSDTCFSVIATSCEGERA